MREKKNKKSYKYTAKERGIARIISSMKTKQAKHYKKWQELDTQISILKAKLKGKYQDQLSKI